MDNETKELAHAVTQARVRAVDGRLFPVALKAQVAAFCRRKRDEGTPMHQLGEALGLSSGQLYSWCRSYPESRFAQVEVIESSLDDTLTLPTSTVLEYIAQSGDSNRREEVYQPVVTLSLISPTGWRVEGLTLSMLAELMGRPS